MNGYDALFISSPLHVHYLTGFDGLSAHDEHTVYLVLTPTIWHLCSYHMYQHEMETVKHNYPTIQLHTITVEQTLHKILQEIVEAMNIQRLGFETERLTYQEYLLLKRLSPPIQLIETHQEIEKKRLYKSEHEVQLIRDAARMTDQCFSHLGTILSEGITEAELAWAIESYIKTHGGELAFPPIVAFDEHAAIPHYQCAQSNPHVKPRQLKKNVSVLLDFGAKVQGYHADMTRTIWFGDTPDHVWQNAYKTVQQAKELVENYVKKTAHPQGSHADTIARDHIINAGYPSFPHSLGHGVGLEIHENPRLSATRQDTIEPGMVFTIEPAIYIPEKFGIRLEDTVSKTETGIEKLTQSPL